MASYTRSGKTVADFEPRRFHQVRNNDNPSIARKIIASPRVATSSLHFPFGKIESPPYTNSMCTQYTSSDVLPS